MDQKDTPKMTPRKGQRTRWWNERMRHEPPDPDALALANIWKPAPNGGSPE